MHVAVVKLPFYPSFDGEGGDFQVVCSCQKSETNTNGVLLLPAATR